MLGFVGLSRSLKGGNYPNGAGRLQAGSCVRLRNHELVVWQVDAGTRRSGRSSPDVLSLFVWMLTWSSHPATPRDGRTSSAHNNLHIR